MTLLYTLISECVSHITITTKRGKYTSWIHTLLLSTNIRAGLLHRTFELLDSWSIKKNIYLKSFKLNDARTREHIYYGKKLKTEIKANQETPHQN